MKDTHQRRKGNLPGVVPKAGVGRPIITLNALLAELERGTNLSAIARKYRVTRRGLVARVGKLRAKGLLVAQVHPPEQHQTMQQQRTAFELFLTVVQKCEMLLAAYEEKARHPDKPGAYCIDPDASEQMVTYQEEIIDKDGKSFTCKRRCKLSTLITRLEKGLAVDIKEVTHKGADWRVEMRHLLGQIADMMKTGAELRAMVRGTEEAIAWMEAVKAEINSVEPEVARRIARAVRKHMMLVLPMQPPAKGTEGDSKP